MANLGFVFTECLRSAFALGSLPEEKTEGEKEEGKEEELRIENYPGAAAIPSLEGYAEGGGYASQINHLPTLSGNTLFTYPAAIAAPF